MFEITTLGGAFEAAFVLLLVVGLLVFVLKKKGE